MLSRVQWSERVRVSSPPAPRHGEWASPLLICGVKGAM